MRGFSSSAMLALVGWFCMADAHANDTSKCYTNTTTVEWCADEGEAKSGLEVVLKARLANDPTAVPYTATHICYSANTVTDYGNTIILNGHIGVTSGCNGMRAQEGRKYPVGQTCAARPQVSGGPIFLVGSQQCNDGCEYTHQGNGYGTSTAVPTGNVCTPPPIDPGKCNDCSA